MEHEQHEEYDEDRSGWDDPSQFDVPSDDLDLDDPAGAGFDDDEHESPSDY